MITTFTFNYYELTDAQDLKQSKDPTVWSKEEEMQGKQFCSAIIIQ